MESLMLTKAAIIWSKIQHKSILWAIIMPEEWYRKKYKMALQKGIYCQILKYLLSLGIE